MAPPTDRVICCAVDDCTCAIEEAARTEVLVHIHEGQAVCAHHADAPHDPAVQPFPCAGRVPQQRKAAR